MAEDEVPIRKCRRVSNSLLTGDGVISGFPLTAQQNINLRTIHHLDAVMYEALFQEIA
jgi:hypothetical protein